MTPNLVEEIETLGPWFHNLHLPDGTQTAPGHVLGDFPRYKWEALAPHLPRDLTGWTALDIGCNAGFYSFELARRGARVRGIDADPRYLRQARWAARRMGFEDRVAFDRLQVYDLARESVSYDLVLFLGVLYHLRYPMLGLDIVAEKVRRVLVFQSLTVPEPEAPVDARDRHIHDREALGSPAWPRLSFVEHTFAADPTNWWVPNRACSEAMLRSAGFRVRSAPADEIYVCEPDPQNPSPMRTWNRSEYLSAVGARWMADEGSEVEALKFQPRAGSIEALDGTS